MYLFRKMAGSCFLNLGLVGGRVKNVKNVFFFFKFSCACLMGEWMIRMSK